MPLGQLQVSLLVVFYSLFQTPLGYLIKSRCHLTINLGTDNSLVCIMELAKPVLHSPMRPTDSNLKAKISAQKHVHKLDP